MSAATPIANAPAWLSRAVHGQPCSGCGSAHVGFVGVYIRPGRSRLIAYGVCACCVADLQRVAETVEKWVRGYELLECCTTPGGAA